MPRMARFVAPHHPHHVTQRGNRRQTTFFRDDDYRLYLDLLRQASAHAGTAVLAYCLMPNHVHLILVPTHGDGLRAAIAETHRRYTSHVNAREGWRGHLWQERFHSFVMDDIHLAAAVPYVEMNPVQARLCKRPEDWAWSSARARRSGRPDPLVDSDRLAQLLPGHDKAPTDETPTDLDLIRRHTRTGRPLGSDEFVAGLEQSAGRTLRPQRPGPKQA